MEGEHADIALLVFKKQPVMTVKSLSNNYDGDVVVSAVHEGFTDEHDDDVELHVHAAAFGAA